MPDKIKWEDAIAAKGQWSGVGNIRQIYTPCRELLSRWQKAYQAAHSLRKRPNLTEAITFALVLVHDRLQKECKKLEKQTADRAAVAFAMELASKHEGCAKKEACGATADPDCECFASASNAVQGL